MIISSIIKDNDDKCKLKVLKFLKEELDIVFKNNTYISLIKRNVLELLEKLEPSTK